MKIINGDLVTLVSFDTDYTEATLTRIHGVVHKVVIPKRYFTMAKLEQFTNLDNDSFVGLADIQTKIKYLRGES